MPDDSAPTRTAYDPTEIEDKWYDFWEANGFFEARVDPDKEPHVIMMPPPNVTGRLHMGHALQSTIQDALTRMRRMQGYESLWMPGKDHAGIATQNVVEERLRENEGRTRHDLGREQFVDRVWDWKQEYGDIISQQMRQLGVSCDWSRERFTMDEGFTRAVQEIFVRLYEDGLIYRGDYMVNWDPENQTALSDEEVDNVERDGHLWHIRYPLSEATDEDVRTRYIASQRGEGREAYLTIATTRPETMLGDTAVAVHPDDERYQGLVGRTVTLPLVNREIPVIADDYIDSSFGTGALKVTPAHDENDFEIGRKNDLDAINVVNDDGTISEHGGPYEGLDRFAARKRIVQDLEEKDLLEKVEDYEHKVPVSSRSGAVIEPLISRQWFVEMEPLAEPAIEAVESGDVQFYPERWENEYFRWMDNIRDWCISRQLWWGHRLPVWYYTDDDGAIDESRDYVVSIEQPEAGMVQETDVLDTWFSSWLWPFATLGWPDETDDLDYFYPTDVLVSGYDILFFWIARMMMAGLYVTDEAPFHSIFMTGMVKDAQGRWMSKSLGNGIDPLEMVNEYGADAVRYSLTVLCAQGQDIKLDPSRFEMGRNFANKIWNAYNVFDQFMEDGKTYERRRPFDELDLVEQWMLHRLNETIAEVEEATDRYRLNEALAHIYDLFWRDYCDWYLELIKPGADGTMDDETIALATEIYETMLKLLHPFMPFITEELWHRLRDHRPGDDGALIAAGWPEHAGEAETDARAAENFGLIQAMITEIRRLKSEYGVKLREKVSAIVNVPADDDDVGSAPARQIEAHEQYFAHLAGVADLTVGSGQRKPKASASAVIGVHEVFVPLEGLIDLEQERERLRSDIADKQGFLKSVEGKLANEQFVEKAPEEIVERERQKQRDTRAEIEQLSASLENLS